MILLVVPRHYIFHAALFPFSFLLFLLIQCTTSIFSSALSYFVSLPIPLPAFSPACAYSPFPPLFSCLSVITFLFPLPLFPSILLSPLPLLSYHPFLSVSTLYFPPSFFPFRPPPLPLLLPLPPSSLVHYHYPPSLFPFITLIGKSSLFRNFYLLFPSFPLPPFSSCAAARQYVWFPLLGESRVTMTQSDLA